MKNLYQNFINYFSPLINYLRSFLQPSKTFVKGKFNQEIAYNRNKGVCIFYSIIIITTIMQMMTGSVRLYNGIVSITVSALIIISMSFSWIVHPEILKVIYNLIMTAGPMILASQNDAGAHRAWIGVQIYPVVALWCTGSLYHFFLNAIVQLIFLNTIYQGRMVNSVTYMSPEAFIRLLTEASNTMCFMNVIIVLCLQITLQKANNRVLIAEKKKDEFERQKIFLLGFSHELRNLLNSVIGNIKLANLETVQPKVKDFLKTADLCGELLIHLVNNILDTGKVEIGDLEINPASNSIYSTLGKTWNICSELIRRKNLDGRIRIQRDIPQTVMIDHHRLTQVFLNLVGNAVKFTDHGMIDISIEWHNDVSRIDKSHFKPHPFDEDDEEGVFQKNQTVSIVNQKFILLNLSNNDVNHSMLHANPSDDVGLLKIMVNDSGCGLTQKDINLIFQKFAQVNSDVSKRKLGTGLGLFITKQLVEKMDGEIRVYSKQGNGTCFIICMLIQPVLDNINQVSEAVNLREIDSSQNLKALVIDDEHFSLNILQHFLVRLNIEVVGSGNNGLMGYRKYVNLVTDDNQPNIITLDLEMPVLDGKKAAELIREFERKEKIEPCLLIIVSGNCSESEISECLNVDGKIRANAFLKKPASVEQLSQIITRHFGSERSTNI